MDSSLQNDPTDEIILHGYGPAFGVADPSPFVTKVEILLKMANRAYRIERADIRRAPKGKVPWIIDGGRVVADSSLIRHYLEREYKVDFDSGLNLEQRGLALATERMVEEHLFWGAFHARWIIDDNFNAGPVQFFQSIPAIVRPLFIKFFRSRARRYLHAQGLGRHDAQDIDYLITADINALAAILGDKKYMFGDQPCGADASIYAFVSGILSKTFHSEIRDAAERHPNLEEYCTNCEAIWFPDGFTQIE